MDRQTLVNYGWIVIAALVIAIMLALATPFGKYIMDGVSSVANGYINASNEAMSDSNKQELVDEWNSKWLSTDCEHKEFEKTTTATCTQDGIATYKCKRCGYTYTETDYAHHIYDSTGLTCEKCKVTFVEYTFGAFDYDQKMDTTILTDAIVHIPETFEYQGTHYKVTSIKTGGFDSCKSLKEIYIPDTVITINGGTFQWCESLEKVVLPNTITELPSSIFAQCTSLKEVVIPNSVKTIRQYAFNNCSALEEITIPDSVTTMEKSVFYKCSLLKKVTISKNIKILPQHIFNSCTSLSDIKLPDGITTIEKNAFYDCNALEKINIPNSVKTIEGQVFVRSGVKEIIIPEGVTAIESLTFSGCKKLEKITLPSTITSIGTQAFQSCESLSTFVFNGTTSQWSNITLNNYWNSAMLTKQIQCNNGTITL